MAGAKTPTGQTVLLKKVFLHKLNFFILVSCSLPGWPNAVVVCHPLSSSPCHSPPLNLACHHHLPPLSSTTVVIRRRRCHPPPPSSSADAIFCRRSHHRHSTVSTFSCRPLLSLPDVVRRPILHSVVFRHYHCPPLPLWSAAAVFHRHSHHHNYAVSAVSHRLSCPSPLQSAT